MNWKKLLSMKDSEPICRGSVLRFPARWPYEEFVELMVFVNYEPNEGMGLIATTGNKSGLTAVVLPKESLGDFAEAISSTWLKENWSEWVFSDCRVEDVYVSSGL